METFSRKLAVWKLKLEKVRSGDKELEVIHIEVIVEGERVDEVTTEVENGKENREWGLGDRKRKMTWERIKRKVAA